VSLLIRIDAEIEKRSLLKHPFYRKWSEGKLTKENLAGYSMEYFQLSLDLRGPAISGRTWTRS
jgi:pyrroloquinoline-quinone synthase